MCMVMSGNLSAMSLDDRITDGETDSHTTVCIRCFGNMIFPF